MFFTLNDCSGKNRSVIRTGEKKNATLLRLILTQFLRRKKKSIISNFLDFFHELESSKSYVFSFFLLFLPKNQILPNHSSLCFLTKTIHLTRLLIKLGLESLFRDLWSLSFTKKPGLTERPWFASNFLNYVLIETL